MLLNLGCHYGMIELISKYIPVKKKVFVFIYFDSLSLMSGRHSTDLFLGLTIYFMFLFKFFYLNYTCSVILVSSVNISGTVFPPCTSCFQPSVL